MSLRRLPAILALPALAGVALAQPEVPATPTAPQVSLTVQAATSLLVTGLVGVLTVGLAPGYSRAIVERIRRRPGEATVRGVVAFVIVVVAAVLLAITVIGLVVVVPGMILFGIASAVGAVLGWTTAAAAVVDDDSLYAPMAIGVVVSVVVGLVPFLGGLVNFLVGMAGFGAMVGHYRS